MATDSVQKIKEKLSIIDVISPYVNLHKAGKNFKGKSPFTAEKTPSFYVSPDRGMYYCFSSSQGGDMFTFVEKMEGVDFLMDSDSAPFLEEATIDYVENFGGQVGFVINNPLFASAGGGCGSGCGCGEGGGGGCGCGSGGSGGGGGCGGH